MQFGGALGLAILSAVATARTNGVHASDANSPLALTAGFQRAFLIGAVFALAAALIAFIAASTHADEHKARLHSLPTPIADDA